MPRISRMALTATMMAAVLGPAQARGEGARVSGVISSVDLSSATLVIDEVGPWRLEQGQTVITRRTVRWDLQTRFARYRRTADAPSGYRGDFVEQRADASALAPGTFVTVECQREGARLRAASVVIPELSEP